MNVPRGKGVGGSALINCLLYSRGNKFDFQSWSDLVNDSSWNYDHLLPYFKKSENFTLKNLYFPVDVDYHGYEGPLHMSQSTPFQNFSSSFFRASQQLGYNVTDYNGEQQIGASILQYYINNGKRSEPGSAFVAPIKKRKNLVVLEESYVTKIKICKKSKKVKGVVFTRKNKTYIARQRKEVILSAGSYSSAQILMLSGVGPQDHLESLGIEIIQNSPVGKTMHDHTLTVLVFTSNITTASQSQEESVRQFLRGEGPLTRPLSYDAIGWFKTSLPENDSFPDMELYFHNISDSAITKKYIGWTEETYSALNISGANAFTILLIPSHPTSIGTIKLNSSDPFEYPLIDPNILSADEDMETLYGGVQQALKLMEADAFRRMNVTLAFDRFPGCDHTEPLSKEYWYCYFGRVTSTMYHPMSTCSIGSSPQTGVVDNELKVFGLKGLRVADASVIPFSYAGHPSAACFMIGEKISDVIKKLYN